MATFIQGVTDTNLDPVLFTPDYSFLRYNLEKKTAQYEQGLKSVSNTYGSLKKELSDPTNVKRRDDYLKLADEQLQKIASSDLSLQQNVSAANAIFEPIATDPAIAYDMYHTGRIKKEMSEMEAWADSDDMATRKKFNPDLYNWLKRDVDSLKNGKGDVKNYKVQGRKAWAYVDPQDIINAAAKEHGFKVEHDATGKPYIVTTTGGPTFAPNYEMFANNVLAANSVYQTQLGYLGQADAESAVEKGRQLANNPNLTNTQALSLFVDTKFKEGRTKGQQYVKSLEEKLAAQKAEYEAYYAANPNAKGDVLALMQKKYQDLNGFKKQVDDIRSDHNKQYGADDASYEKNKKAFAENFLTSPESYFANNRRTEDVIKWSNIRSSFGTVSIKADQGYIGLVNAADKALNTLNNIKDDQFDNQVDAAELGLKQDALALKIKKLSTTATRKNADGTDRLADVEYLDISSWDINTTTAINQLKDKLAVNKAAAMSNMTSTFGGLYLLERMGVKPEEVSLVRQFFMTKDGDPNYKGSKAEQEALVSAHRTMFAFSKQNGMDDVTNSMREGMSKKETVNNVDFPKLLKMAAAKFPAQNSQDDAAIRSLFDYEHNQAEVKRLAGVVDNAEKTAMAIVQGSADAKEFSKIIKEHNGKSQLLNESDIEAALSGKGLDGKPIIPAEIRKQMAQAFFSGGLDVSITKPEGAAAAARTGGSTAGYVDFTFQGRSYHIDGTPFANLPTPAEYKKLIRRFNERVPIPLLGTDMTGAAAQGSAGFIIRNEAADKIKGILRNSTQTNANIKNADGTDVDSEDQQAIRDGFADPDAKNAVVEIWANSSLNDGKQVVKVTFPGASSDKEKEQKPYKGQTFYFPINVTGRTSSETLQLFQNLDDADEFAEYSKNNKPYVMDYHEGSGIKVTIMADYPGSKQGKVVVSSKMDKNQYVDYWVDQEPMVVDFNKTTFSEVKEMFYGNVISPYVNAYRNYNKQLQAQNGAQGVGSSWNELKLKW